MKLIYSIASILLSQVLSSQVATAANAEVLQALVGSEYLKSSDITNIQQTAIYRCPGCYTFEVTTGHGDQIKTETFGTSMQITNGARKYIVSKANGDESLATLANAPRASCIALGRVGGEGMACAKHTDQKSCENTSDWEWCAWRSR